AMSIRKAGIENLYKYASRFNIDFGSWLLFFAKYNDWLLQTNLQATSDEHLINQHQTTISELQAHIRTLEDKLQALTEIEQELGDTLDQKLDEQKADEQNINKQNINKQNIDEQNIDEQNIDEQNIDEQNIDEQNIDEQKSDDTPQ
ncbi:MAG: hypothetical protein AAFZ92_07970, partial [Pseudomonadota bacterium]